MNQKGVVLSGLIYALLTFFLLLLASLLMILWYRQNSINSLGADANEIYDYVAPPLSSTIYSYTGNYQTFVAPATGNYKIELWGASGGDFAPILGGKGGYTSGDIYLIKDTALYVYIGGSPSGEAGGYNGGGSLAAGQGIYGSAGGGATDIRLVSGAWNDTTSLISRIMVAGAGAGANYRNYVDQACGYGEGAGGYGGGLIGGTGESIKHTSVGGCTYGWGIGTGGTQTIGGSWISYNSAGLLADSTVSGAFGIAQGSTQAGGGSGYYAGGGSSHGGGGGGSSFISGCVGCDAVNASGINTGQPNHYSGYVFTDATMLAGNEVMPTSAGGAETGHTGNGYAKITYSPVATTIYSYSGNYQTFVAPESGNYKIELWGAQGGGTTNTTKGLSLGGSGAYTTGILSLEKGATIYVYVGEYGGNFTSTNVGTVSLYASRFNGGGSGALDSSEGASSGEHGFPGGGATDVRLVNGSWNDSSSLISRIMVAAGGGGGGWSGNGASDQYYAGGGGAGGALTGVGAVNATNSTPGTQTGGGIFGVGSNGIFGTGGNNNGTGGGGGGYYGGKQGLSFAKPNASGSGASSFVSGCFGCNAVNAAGVNTGQPNHYSGYVFTGATLIAGNETMPTSVGGVETGHTGNGYAKITYLP